MNLLDRLRAVYSRAKKSDDGRRVDRKDLKFKDDPRWEADRSRRFNEPE